MSAKILPPAAYVSVCLDRPLYGKNLVDLCEVVKELKEHLRTSGYFVLDLESIELPSENQDTITTLTELADLVVCVEGGACDGFGDVAFAAMLKSNPAFGTFYLK